MGVYDQAVSDLEDALDRISELEAEVNRLREDKDVLGKIAHQLRGALQSIADGIGDQKTAQNALDRLASQGVDGLDVDPEELGIKGRIEELEAEVERLREKIGSIRIWLNHIPERKRAKSWKEAMWHVNDALDNDTDE